MNTFGIAPQKCELFFLNPINTLAEIIELSQEVAEENWHQVMIPPYVQPDVYSILAPTNTSVGTIIDFPSQGAARDARVHAAELTLQKDSKQIETSVNLGVLRSRDWFYLEEDLQAVAHTAHHYEGRCGAMIDPLFLTDVELENFAVIIEDSTIDNVTLVQRPKDSINLTKTDYVRKPFLELVNDIVPRLRKALSEEVKLKILAQSDVIETLEQDLLEQLNYVGFIA